MNFIILILIAACVSFAASAEPARQRLCYSTAETRDKIVSLGLFEPFHVMRSAATKLQAEAIGAKLCRWSEDLVYELSFLRHDGRILHMSIDAKTGKVVGARDQE